MKVNFYYTTLHSRDSCLTWAGTTNLRIMIGEIYCFVFAIEQTFNALGCIPEGRSLEICTMATKAP